VVQKRERRVRVRTDEPLSKLHMLAMMSRDDSGARLLLRAEPAEVYEAHRDELVEAMRTPRSTYNLAAQVVRRYEDDPAVREEAEAVWAAVLAERERIMTKGERW
jgi:hypothetical protein